MSPSPFSPRSAAHLLVRTSLWLGLVLTALILIPASGAVAASQTTVSYSFTGAEQTFRVPAGVSSVRAVAVGAPGGAFYSGAYSSPGSGGRTTATVPVKAGETLYIDVGGAGAAGNSDAGSGGGGFNGGAPGGLGQSSEVSRGGGGGGASDVRTCSRTAGTCPGGGTTLGSRVLIAAGGGGASGSSGGAGGALSGGNGAAGSAGTDRYGVAGGGGGGTQTAGGSGGTSTLYSGYNGSSGGLGTGGAGGQGVPSGGGGGGGRYGGGGGAAGGESASAGGGGGSSFGPAGSTFARDTTDSPAITLTFVGSAPPPQAVTGSASGSTATRATVHGTVNPEGLPTTYHFDWGQTTRYGHTAAARRAGSAATPTHSAGSGTATRPVSAHLRGLRPNTVYHYRIVASNAGGTRVGRDRTFKTPRLQARTRGVSSLSPAGVTIHGTVNPGGLLTTYRFQYGTSRRYGHATARRRAGSGTTLRWFAARLSGLRPNVLYHYRIVATNATGRSFGRDMTFRIPARRLSGYG